jgi:hypothetical protein
MREASYCIVGPGSGVLCKHIVDHRGDGVALGRLSSSSSDAHADVQASRNRFRREPQQAGQGSTATSRWLGDDATQNPNTRPLTWEGSKAGMATDSAKPPLILCQQRMGDGMPRRNLILRTPFFGSMVTSRRWPVAPFGRDQNSSRESGKRPVRAKFNSGADPNPDMSAGPRARRTRPRTSKVQ